MARYIDADAYKAKLLEKLEEAINLQKDAEKEANIDKMINAEHTIDAFVESIFALDNEPTSDVVERKTGKWKCICSTDYWQYTYEHYRCSECGIPAEGAFRYCPNCGARMESE